jgi:inner membrane protein
MATLLHLAVGMVAGRAHAGGGASAREVAFPMLGYAALSVLPDADCAGFVFGVPYGAEWGHRGAAHSPAFAVLVGALVGIVARAAGGRAMRTFVLAALVTASHGVLDAFTDGGLGIAFTWPLSEARYFLPWRPLPIAPIGPGMFSARGAYCLLVEAVASAPLVALALWPRRRGERSSAAGASA